MEEYSFLADAGAKGLRLDKLLVLNLPGNPSRSFIQRLIKDSGVLVNGGARKAHYIVREGERIEVRFPPPPSASGIKSEKIALDIIYEDADILVVNKPAGMVVHPAPGNWSGTLVNALVGHSKDLSGEGDASRPGIVHRLDKGTSGLLVVAKNDEAHRGLANQFKTHSIKRTYVAIVKGKIELDNAKIDLPIGRSRRDRKKMGVVFAKSRDALTRYKVLKRFEDCTLLEVNLKTGRTHQIRVHMAYIGHPILGDDKYGAKGMFARPALHAKTLGFIHPSTGKFMEFDSEPPDDMKKLIERCSHGKDH